MNLQSLSGKNIAIWGLGKEGLSALKYLRKKLPEQCITLINDQPISEEQQQSLKKYDPIQLVCSSSSDQLVKFELIIKSPGISIYKPEIEIAKNQGVQFTSATNLWFEAVQGSQIIAVTGTKGKSTTVSMLAHMLQQSDYSVAVGGNIGTPLLDLLAENQAIDLWLIELSSYQISDLVYTPDIAVLLNLYPEHIQWHQTFENYYRDKLNLFSDEQCLAVVNGKDKRSKSYFEKRDNTLYFNQKDAFHVKEATIYYQDQALIKLGQLNILGEHNLINCCAALTILNQLNVDWRVCLNHLSEFKGLPHRLQILGEKDKVLYISDCISTTPESTIAAIAALEHLQRPIALIIGGQDRQQNFEALAKYIMHSSVEVVIAVYETGERVLQAINNVESGNQQAVSVYQAEDLSQAVFLAQQNTRENGAILLSPAAPSYDAFNNYQEKGGLFAGLLGTVD